MALPILRLKKGEERRIRTGHPWVFSNEVATSLKQFTPGAEVQVLAHDESFLGMAYVNPHSLIAARIFSRQQDMRLDGQFFYQQLQTALTLRQTLFQAPYYRLVFGEGDFIPGLIIDRFEQDFVCQINTAGIEVKKEALSAALRRVFPDTRSILLRNDSAVRQYEGLETYTAPLFGEPPQETILKENQCSFGIPLWQGQKTGWFFDHRPSRARLADYVKEKSVLDVFSYLGAWGIQAAVYGASSVECIETSALAADYIKQNAVRNQVGEKVNVIQEDAFDALKALQQAGKTFDVIILDPPAFIKKAKDQKAGLAAYQRLNELALKILNPNGILFSCSCSMHLSVTDLNNLLQRAAYKTQCTLQLIERGHQGPDHPVHIAIPETDYLKAFVLRKIG